MEVMHGILAENTEKNSWQVLLGIEWLKDLVISYKKIKRFMVISCGYNLIFLATSQVLTFDCNSKWAV